MHDKIKPKIISFDQNIWIKLARVYSGKEKNPEIKNLITDLFHLKESGECIFPVSYQRLFETQKQKNAIRREELAKFMCDLSGGYTIRPSNYEFIKMEGMNYFRTEYLDLPKKDKIYFSLEHIVKKDFANITGCILNVVPTTSTPSEEQKKMILNANNNGKILYKALILRDDKQIILQCEDLKKIANQMMINKKKINIKDQLKRKNIALNLYLVVCILPLLNEVRLQIDIPVQQVKKIGDGIENYINFLKKIPSAYVTFELIQIRDKATEIEINDIMDIAFLSVAIPYSSIVVTDKKFRDLSIRCKLDKIYGTIVLSDVIELKKYIQKETILGLKRIERSNGG